MICYVYKGSVRVLISRKKIIRIIRVIMSVCLVLEGIKFALETFLDNKDLANIFASIKGGFRADTDFKKPGFYDVDIDEFPVYVPQGTQYQKKSFHLQKN